MVVGPDGPVGLRDVFEGRRMLIGYHFMWNPGAPQNSVKAAPTVRRR